MKGSWYRSFLRLAQYFFIEHQGKGRFPNVKCLALRGISMRRCAVVSMLMLTPGICNQARAAYYVTDLTYTVGTQTLTGYSGTYLDYYEAYPDWYCINYDVAYFPGAPEGTGYINVCIEAILLYAYAEVVATEYSPSGQVSYRYGYATPSTAVGFPPFSSPQGGTWYANGMHYVQTEHHWCDMIPQYVYGYISYVPQNCAHTHNTGTFLGNSYDEVVIGTPLQPTGASIDTEPSVFHIDRNLIMPAMQFSATASPSSLPYAEITYHWYLEITYAEHGRNYVHRVPQSGTIDIIGNSSWTPDWAGLLAGGNNVTVYVSVSANGGTSPTTSKTGFQIHGENPTQAQLFTYANFVEAQAVMWQESTHRQFNAARYTGTGLPLRGPPDGWGLMQRDPLQSEAQLWNWQTALQDGIAYLNLVRSNAQSYLNTWHAQAAATPDPGDDWTWNPSTQFSDRVWNDAFSRYNTGNPIYSPNGNQGVENCGANQAGCNYKNAVRAHINNPPW